MIDFHSTGRNLFYVQGQEATAGQNRFFADWLVGKENLHADFPFTIVRSHTNPGSGTSKSWFHASYGIPAITYEVGDNTEKSAAAAAASELAVGLIAALDGIETSSSGN